MINSVSGQKLNTLLVVFLFLIFTSCTQKQNWPQFRGPESNNVSTTKSLPVEWGDSSNIQWKYKMDGAGFSSPIVWGDKVFITSAFPVKVNAVPEREMTEPPEGSDNENGEDAAPQGGQDGPPPPPEQPVNSYLEEVYRWDVTCLDLNTGKELWKKVAYEGAPKVNKHPESNYATETPVTDGKRLYVYFGMTGLFCYDLDGNLLWQKDLGSFETQNGWGTGSSPALFEDILYIQNDNDTASFVVALDAATGDQKWRVERTEKTTYATPFVWENKIRNELVLMGKTVYSYDLKTGAVLWQINIGGEQSIPSPTADMDHIFIGNPGGAKILSTLFAVKAGAEGDITLPEGASSGTMVEWTVPDADLGNNSPLLYKGLLYYLGGENGTFTILNSSDGKQVYSKRFTGAGEIWASPWAYDGMVGYFDERGTTRIIKAGEPFDVLYENKLSDKFWPSVAITGDALILKGAEWLYCVKN
jgi:outer membrane protein assembly factor BamB